MEGRAFVGKEPCFNVTIAAVFVPVVQNTRLRLAETQSREQFHFSLCLLMCGSKCSQPDQCAKAVASLIDSAA